MVALLGAFIGFLGALVPEVMKMWHDHRDKAHELAILDRQLQAQEQGHIQQTEMMGQWADVAEQQVLHQSYQTQIRWVDALNGTVRPVLAYAFFLLYAFVKYQHAVEMPWLLWEEDDRAIFAGIISFYFGQRAIQRYRRAV